MSNRAVFSSFMWLCSEPTFKNLKIPHLLRHRHHEPETKVLALKSVGRGSNLATVKSLFSFFLPFFLLLSLSLPFFYTFILTFLGLERAHFPEYRYYLPFSHNKLSNTVTHMGHSI